MGHAIGQLVFQRRSGLFSLFSRKTLKRLQSFSEPENFSSSENNNEIITTSLRITYGCFVAATTEVATTLRHVHVSVPSFFPFIVVEVKGLFFSEILFPFTCMGSLS